MSDIDLNVPDHAITTVQRIVVLDEGNAIVWPLSPDEPIQFLTTHAIDDEFEDTIKQTIQYDHVCTQIANRKYGPGWAATQVTQQDYLDISNEATRLLGIEGFDEVIAENLDARMQAMDQHPAQGAIERLAEMLGIKLDQEEE